MYPKRETKFENPGVFKMKQNCSINGMNNAFKNQAAYFGTTTIASSTVCGLLVKTNDIATRVGESSSDLRSIHADWLDDRTSVGN